jgi:hypothetical protein
MSGLKQFPLAQTDLHVLSLHKLGMTQLWERWARLPGLTLEKAGFA